VRFITNPSSGKMGFALARIAARRGAEVTLVSGPTLLPDPAGVPTIRVGTALEMERAVLDLAPQMDAIIMTAAVGDYRPAQTAPQKIKKASDEMTVHLVRNPDILASLGKSRPPGSHRVLVGFAAETEHLIENAREKLIQKNLDFIVANNLTESGSGFGFDTNRVKIIDPTGAVEELPMLSKDEVAARILDRVESILA
jgi:phosphopantothenoylcysteine decarboxylase/phosphopantothenate--cysteine ligase